MSKFLSFVIRLFFVAVVHSEVFADKPPNIVLILADDLGWADVPWHGATAKMPQLADMATDGIKLESHYVHPMCSPTRTALMTGRYASRFGVTAAQNERALPWSTVTLANCLKNAGYDTALIGKWHLGSKPEEGPQKFGFDHGYGSLAGGCGPFDHRYKTGPVSHTWHRNGILIEEEGHVTDLLAREAVEWLEQRDDRPFFLYLPFTAIHVPLAEPQKWLDMNVHLTDPGERLRAACSSHLDDTILLVIESLRRKKLLDNTLVIFLSDNGAHAPMDNQGGPYPGTYERFKVGNHNLPWRGHKSSLYEGGIRTPGVVYWPNKIPAGEVHTPLHAIDWMPTLCRLANAETPKDLRWDGIDIWPILTKETDRELNRPLYCAGVGFRTQTVRQGDWKLIVNHSQKKNTNPPQPSNVSFELYNLGVDPGETKNLAESTPDILRQLQNQLDELSSRDRDSLVNDS